MARKAVSAWSEAALVLALWALTASLLVAQPAGVRTANDYIVGAQDVLTITSYDQADLSGKFTVEADGTFTYPYIGRFRAGGLKLRDIEARLKDRLKEDGYFTNPQLTVAIDQYRSQRVFVVGEVRMPGTYTLSGNMSLVEALARAGSTLPSASGEAIIVHGGDDAAGPSVPPRDSDDVVRIDLRELENGAMSRNAQLRDGDTIFVPRSEAIYVFGQVKNPGAFGVPRKNTTVLQALALAGGVTDRGATTRIRIIRMAGGVRQEIRVKLDDAVQPGDTIIVPERFF
jgi:polysaccharide biosynthesis/export protein